jgi:hypothetical protein
MAGKLLNHALAHGRPEENVINSHFFSPRVWPRRRHADASPINYAGLWRARARVKLHLNYLIREIFF